MDIDPNYRSSGGRWFVSIEMPEPLKEDLERLKTSATGIRWTPPQQLHLTLRFIGECEPDTLETLAGHLADIRVEPFILVLESVGSFPKKGHARILWAGVGSGHPRLFQLQQRIEEAVIRSGLEPESRRFHPHITLARCGRASPGAVKEFLKTHHDYAAGPFRVERFSLFVSRLTSEGAIHREVAAFALLGA